MAAGYFLNAQGVLGPAKPSENPSTNIPPTEIVCGNYRIHEIPPTTPPATFAGNFIYALNVTQYHGPYMHGYPTGTDPTYEMAAGQAAQIAENQKRKRDTTPVQPKALTERVKTQQPNGQGNGEHQQGLKESPAPKRKATETPEEKEKNRTLKKRQKKDPKAPKRNMSAFLFFSNVRRAEVKKTHPDLSFSEIAKVLSQMWRSVSIEEKRDYTERARKDKVRYFQEKKTYDDQCKAMGIVVQEEGFSEEDDDEILDDEVFEAKLEQLDGMEYTHGTQRQSNYMMGLGNGPVSLNHS